MKVGTDKVRLLKNFFSLGVIQIANYVIPFISVPIVSRIIGPEKFGVINFSGAFVVYFSLLISYGFNLTATRKVAADPNNLEKRNEVFSEVFCAQGLLLLISTFFFLICLSFIPHLRAEWKVSVFTYLICISTFLTQDWLFQAMQDLSKVALFNFIAKLVFIFLIIVTINKKEDYAWYALALSISQMIVAIATFIWAVKNYNLRLKFVSLLRLMNLLWSEKTYFITLVIINLYTNTSIVLLGLMTDSAQVGYYTAAQKVIVIIQSIIVFPLRQALFPYMTKEIASDVNNGIIIAQKILPVVLVITSLISAITFFLSDFIVVYLYGYDYKSAVIVLRILSFVPLIVVLSNIWGLTIMMNLRFDNVYFTITALCAFVSVVLNLILINQYGSVRLSVTWLITEFIGLSLIFLYLTKKKIKLVNFSYFTFQFYYNKILGRQ